MKLRDLLAFRLRDPVKAAARRYARLVVRWRQKNPGTPLHQCIAGTGLEMLLQLVPEASEQRERLERLAAPEYATEDIREFCRSLVTFETGIGPEDEQRYREVETAVDRELQRLGVAVYTDSA